MIRDSKKLVKLNKKIGWVMELKGWPCRVKKMRFDEFVLFL